MCSIMFYEICLLYGRPSAMVSRRQWWLSTWLSSRVHWPLAGQSVNPPAEAFTGGRFVQKNVFWEELGSLKHRMRTCTTCVYKWTFEYMLMKKRFASYLNSEGRYHDLRKNIDRNHSKCPGAILEDSARIGLWPTDFLQFYISSSPFRCSALTTEFIFSLGPRLYQKVARSLMGLMMSGLANPLSHWLPNPCYGGVMLIQDKPVSVGDPRIQGEGLCLTHGQIVCKPNSVELWCEVSQQKAAVVAQIHSNRTHRFICEDPNRCVTWAKVLSHSAWFRCNHNHWLPTSQRDGMDPLALHKLHNRWLWSRKTTTGLGESMFQRSSTAEPHKFFC